MAAKVPCSPVNDIPAALADPQAQARNMVQEVVDSQGSRVPQVGPVAKMSETPPSIRTAPPYLGEHTAQILRERLGFDDDLIAQLRAEGVIG